jgi:hypothetical protein
VRPAGRYAAPAAVLVLVRVLVRGAGAGGTRAAAKALPVPTAAVCNRPMRGQVMFLPLLVGAAWPARTRAASAAAAAANAAAAADGTASSSAPPAPPPWQDECAGDWASCRQNLIRAIFNASETPSRDPDFIVSNANWSMSGLPGPGHGTGVGEVQWTNNMSQLIWTMTGPFISLNTTVLYTLNTSGRAAANYNPPPYKAGSGPGIPQPGSFETSYAPQVVPHHISDTLLIYHNGHETATCTPNYDGVVDHFNQLGYGQWSAMPRAGCRNHTYLREPAQSSSR